MNKSGIFTVAFSRVYPFYVQKAERKGRSREDVDTVIRWLTGYSQQALQRHIDGNTDFETFFAQAPQINPDISKITGRICGCRVEEIEDRLMHRIRCLDKLVDELSKGRSIEKVLRRQEDAGIRKSEKSEFASVDEYISLQNPAVQPVLHEVRRIIRENAPLATERISWRMPTYWQGENLIHFASCRNHLGIYPGDLTSTPFTSRLEACRHSRGAIRFPYDRAIDFDLIAEIVRYKVKKVTDKK